MLHYVQQLVANCVCLLFGAQQVVQEVFVFAENSRKQRYESGESEPEQ